MRSRSRSRRPGPWGPVPVLAGLVVLGTAVPLAVAQTGDEAEADPPRPKLYDETADAKAQIAETVARAKKENRRVLVQWGAEWCHWCHLLHDHFKTDKAVQRKLQYEYDLVLVDIGRMDKNLHLAEGYGAEFKKHGVPFLTVLDGEGKVLANQPTGPLEAEGAPPRHDGDKVLAFLEKHQAPYRSAESVLAEGLEAARAQEKLVLLHFGAPWCGWCHRFEDWLARPEVAKVLARDFVDLKIDIDRTIGGKDLSERYARGRPTGIPFFVFLRGDGTTVADSFGPKGNIGCPHAVDEIAHFRKLLNEHATRIDAKDVETVTGFLGKKER